MEPNQGQPRPTLSSKVQRLQALSREEWQRDDWRWQMSHRLTSLDDLQSLWPEWTPTEKQKEVAQRYPFALTPYYMSLMEHPGPTDPIGRMAVPQAEEMNDNPALFRDPLTEEPNSPVPGLIHRYPDRVVLLLNGLCPVYCRHCTRKRLVGIEVAAANRKQIEGWVDYLKNTPSVKDVILSGGDPLTLSDDRLEEVLAAVRSVPSVEIIRIGTRIPVLMPMRVTPELCQMLAKYHPVWVVTHFNHPNELSPLAELACLRLLEAGCPVNNQAVLLRGVNDHPDIMEDMLRHLMRIRVRPYYLHQCDLIQGIEHLRTPISRGIEIMEALRGRLGGLAIPQYVVDLPQGGGKVPILPNYILSMSPTKTILRNFEGRIVAYPEPAFHPDENHPPRRERGGLADQLSGHHPGPIIPKSSK
ncbi:MAG: KamA family radical SAM protein [Deltaproteobacteria bacterium]|nr:MAG: KamA family radical SAM protein [Deltaproteobacteria bacterium]